jgi:lysophospholipase L1-like esterase
MKMSKWLAAVAAAALVASLSGLLFLSFAYYNLRKQVVAIAAAGTSHSSMRLAVIQAQLSQVENPIIVIGDSIVETAKWPETICNHPVVNAGISGARIGFFAERAPRFLKGTKSALVVLAIGINDAGKGYDEHSFRSAYSETLKTILSPVAISTIVGGNTPSVNPAEIQQFNKVIGQLAEGRTLIDLHNAVPGDFTIDGIHLSDDGYKLWTAALLSGARRAIGCVEPA